MRFIDLVIGRPAIVSGLSSGGLLAAWLSAYAKPGQIRAAHYEDPPLFNAESDSPSFLAGRGSPFALWRKYLGNQWQVGDWAGMRAAASHELLPWLAAVIEFPEQPTQNMKEYDPEWARACCAGTLTANCDHAQMLTSVSVPVLFTHHFRHVDVTTGRLLGVPSDAQAARVRELVTGAVHPDAGRVGGHAAMTVY